MTSSGERTKSGAIGRRASLQQIRQNALIRKDVMVPKGSRGRNSGGGGWAGKRQRAISIEATDPQLNGTSVAERMVERVAEAVGRKRSGRPGALTLEWKPCERDSLQVSERLSRASGPGWQTDRGVPGRFDPEIGKPVVGEPRGKTLDTLDCGVQCGACPR